MPRIIRFLPLLLIFAFVPIFNMNVIAIRLSELGSLLEEAAGKQDILNNSSIVGRYELLKRRLEQGEARAENYALEARVQALTAPQRVLAPSVQALRYGARPLRAFLNGLRFAMGKAPIHPEQGDATLDALEMAYLHERSRDYGKALEEYGRVIPLLRPGSDLQASALLHVAFCESIINNMGRAREILTRLITENPGREESVLAWKLLGFLDLIEEKRATGLPGTPSELDRAKRTYLLVEYSAAIDLFTSYISKHPDDPRLAEAYFFRARSREELGDLAGAAADYGAIMSQPTAGTWGREGQRRLFLLGAIYGQGDTLARDALGKLTAYPEKDLVDAIRHYARIIDPGTTNGWMSASFAFAPGHYRKAPAQAPHEAPVTMTFEEALAPGAAASTEIIVELGMQSAASTGETNSPIEVLQPLLPALAQLQTVTPALGQPGSDPGFLGERLLDMEGERSRLAQRHQSELKLRTGYDTGSWISLGAGVLSTGAAGYFLYQAFDTYGKYKSAGTLAQAKALREATVQNQTLAITTGVLGGVALTTALLLQLLAPPPTDTQAEIDALDRAIEKLQGTSETPVKSVPVLVH